MGVEVVGATGHRPGKEEVLPAVLKHLHESVDQNFLRNLECTLCITTAESAVVAGDGHLYCQHCWEGYVQTRPVVAGDKVRSPVTQRAVARVAVPCYAVRGLAAVVKQAVE